jgi:hypothetical protein
LRKICVNWIDLNSIHCRKIFIRNQYVLISFVAVIYSQCASKHRRILLFQIQKKKECHKKALEKANILYGKYFQITVSNHKLIQFDKQSFPTGLSMDLEITLSMTNSFFFFFQWLILFWKTSLYHRSLKVLLGSMLRSTSSKLKFSSR